MLLPGPHGTWDCRSHAAGCQLRMRSVAPPEVSLVHLPRQGALCDHARPVIAAAAGDPSGHSIGSRTTLGEREGEYGTRRDDCDGAGARPRHLRCAPLLWPAWDG